MNKLNANQIYVNAYLKILKINFETLTSSHQKIIIF